MTAACPRVKVAFMFASASRITSFVRRSGWRSRLVAGLVLSAALAATVGVGVAQQSDDQRPRGVGLNGDNVERAAHDPVLSKAVWVFLDAGSTDIRTAPELPALRFSPGTTYADALTQLYVSVGTSGALPAGARIVDPLPRSMMLACRADGSLDLNLIAPFGYDEAGRIRPPSYALPGTLSPEVVRERIDAAYESGSALPVGASVDVPEVSRAQTIIDPGASACY